MQAGLEAGVLETRPTAIAISVAVALCALGLALATGCAVGRDSPPDRTWIGSSQDAGGPDDDGQVAGGDSGNLTAGDDAGAGQDDAGGADAGSRDSGTDVTVLRDAGPADARPADAGRADADRADAGRVDASRTDAGRADAGSVDTGPPCPGALFNAALYIGDRTTVGDRGGSVVLRMLDIGTSGTGPAVYLEIDGSGSIIDQGDSERSSAGLTVLVAFVDNRPPRPWARICVTRP